MSFDPISAGFDFAGKLLDKILPDPAAKADAMLKLEQLKQNGELAQLTAEVQLSQAQNAVNEEEAKSSSIFVAGWRPFVGWICGFALAYTFIFQPFLVLISRWCGSTIVPPQIDGVLMANVLFGMLGLGAMHMNEKIKGVAK